MCQSDDRYETNTKGKLQESIINKKYTFQQGIFFINSIFIIFKACYIIE